MQVYSQSTTETINWITGKLVNTGFGCGDKYGNKMVVKNTIKNDGSFKNVQTKYPKTSGEYTSMFTGNLKHMNPESVQIIKENYTYFYKDSLH